MRKLLLPILLFAAFPLLRAQCPNLDFSYRDFTNWRCYISDSWATGQTCYDSLQWKYVTPAIDGRHTIMSDIFADDPRTCNNGMSPSLSLPLVPDGFTCCARIGNPGTGSCADAIRYAIMVDSSNYWVTVHYAAVLEFANHVDGMESRFGIRFQDTAGKPLPVGNLDFSVKDTARMIKCGMVYWTKWEDLSVNLSAWIGQTVELVIYAMDCGKNGHYGYGYAVCECGSPKGNVRYCNNSSIAELSAPTGCRSYSWTDTSGKVVDSVRVMKVANPAIGAVYRCVVDKGTAHFDTITLTISRTLIASSFLYQWDSLSPFIRLKNTSVITGSRLSALTWHVIRQGSGTEYVGIGSTLNYTFKDTGWYEVQLIVSSATGCSDTCSHRFRVEAVSVDVGVLSLMYPDKDTLWDTHFFYPKVRMANFGKNDMNFAVVHIELYDSNMTMISELKESVGDIHAGDTLDWCFADSLRCTDFTGLYFLKAYLDSKFAADTLSSNDTVLKPLYLRYPDSVCLSVTNCEVLYSYFGSWQNWNNRLETNTPIRIRVKITKISNFMINDSLCLTAVITDSLGYILQSQSVRIHSSTSFSNSSYTFPREMRVPGYTGYYYAKVFFNAHPTDAVHADDTCLIRRSCLFKAIIDMKMLSVSPQVDSVDGKTPVFPEVIVCNSGNVDVTSVSVYVMVLDSSGKLLGQVCDSLPSFSAGDTVFRRLSVPYIVPDYTGLYCLKAFVYVSNDVDNSNDTAVCVAHCMYNMKVDVRLVTVVTPTVDGLPGNMRVTPVVRLYNHSNFSVKDIMLKAFLLDSVGIVLDTFAGNVPTMKPCAKIDYRFGSSYKVPNYNGVYYLKVFLTALPADCDLSNDTLVRMAYCLHLDTVDVELMDILQPVATDTLKKNTEVHLKVRICNTGNKILDGLRLHALVLDEKHVVTDTLQGVLSRFGCGDTVDYMFPSGFLVREDTGHFFLRVFPDAVRADMHRDNDTLEKRFSIYRRPDTANVRLISFISPITTDTLWGGNYFSPLILAEYWGNITLSSLNLKMVLYDSSYHMLDYFPATLKMYVQNGDTFRFGSNHQFLVPNYTGFYRLKVFVDAHVSDNNLFDDTLELAGHCRHVVDLAMVSVDNPSQDSIIQGGKIVYPRVQIANYASHDADHVSLCYQLFDWKKEMLDSGSEMVGTVKYGDTLDYQCKGGYTVPNYSGYYFLKVWPQCENLDIRHSNDTLLLKMSSCRFDTVDVRPLSFVFADTLWGGAKERPVLQMLNNSASDISGFSVWLEAADSAGKLLRAWEEGNISISAWDTLTIRCSQTIQLPSCTGKIRMRAFVSKFPMNFTLSVSDTLEQYFQFIRRDTIDVALAALVYPVTTEVLQGNTLVCPKALVTNRGNVEVHGLELTALVYDQTGTLTDSLTGYMTELEAGADTVYTFPTAYLVPNVAGSYSLTVRMKVPDGDISEKDNELQRKLMSKRNLSVDLQMLAVTLSDTGVLAGCTWVCPHVCVANPLRNTEARGVMVYVDVLDSNCRRLVLLRHTIDRIGLADTVEQWFNDSFQVPDYNGLFWVKAYIDGYNRETDYSNDTLLGNYRCQKSDAVTSFFRENWQLGQNTPNPAVERTLVPISLPEAGRVRLQLCSADGRLLYRSYRELPPGKNMLPLDVGGCAAGIYYFSVEYKNECRTIKISVR